MKELTFDIVFIDCGKAAPYDRKSLESRPLGGVEASVIRVSEGLASVRLPNGRFPNVAVIKASDPDNGIDIPYFPPTMGQHAYFMHENEIPRIETRYAIYLRGPKYLGAFKGAKNFVWCHDLATEDIKTWKPLLEEHDATVVAVSRWHKKDIQKHLDYPKITYAYNPVDDALFLPRGKTRPSYNKDLMVWAASPHKGLNEALGVFKAIHEKHPNLRLLVYNPGYIKGETIINPGVLYYGPAKCRDEWHNMRNALCVFYPTQFQETFGLIAAEANAMGVPIISNKTGALNEIVQDDRQLLEVNADIIDQVSKWYTEGPPVVYGRDEFKLSQVTMRWLAVLAGKL